MNYDTLNGLFDEIIAPVVSGGINLANTIVQGRTGERISENIAESEKYKAYGSTALAEASGKQSETLYGIEKLKHQAKTTEGILIIGGSIVLLSVIAFTVKRKKRK